MSLQTDLTDLKISYNASQASIEEELRREHSMYQAYDEPTKQKLTKQKFDKTLDIHKEKFSSFADKIKREKSESLNKIFSYKFPNISSKDSTQKLIGENQLTQAQIFLSSPHSTNQIITAIRKAFDSGRIDYGFSILDTVLESLPDSKLSELTDDQQHLSSALQTIYEGFKNKPDIEAAQEDITEIESIGNTTNILINQLNEGRNYIQHFTRQEVESMTLDQMKDSQILDSVNESMSKWNAE